MSHIEDALKKLQGAVGARDLAKPPKRLAAVVPKGYEYAGHRIEVDMVELRARGLLAPDVDERRLSEQYRAIKRPLLRNAEQIGETAVQRGNLVAVASALSGEGKTFTCVNLCLSIAREKDWSVVLVDGDCSKRDLTRLFGAEDRPGLMDLLRDPSLSFEALVMPTNVSGLSLLPAGARDVHASELIASNRMEELCAGLSTPVGGRMVIFDSSPLLLTTEAAVLASKVGQIVLIVRANETPQQAVLAAIEKLDPAKPIGAVLNQTYDTHLGFSYGDYYGSYGYGDPPN